MAEEQEASELAQDRYRLLVEQLLDELNDNRSAVARKLKISDAHVGYIARKERGAGLDAITKAIKHLGVDFRFFSDPTLGESPYYGDFLVSGEELVWRQFVQNYGRINELTEEDLADLRRLYGKNGGPKTWQGWAAHADSVLATRPSPTFDRA